MFKHIVEIDGKFYVRRWTPLGLGHWGANGHWWFDHSLASGFSSAEEAEEAFSAARARRPRFVRWI